MYSDILIVGAGCGGAQAAIALRQGGFRGSITIVGEELDLPYERPPLSKQYLTGELAFERMLSRSQAFWTAREVRFLLSQRVTGVDPRAHRVSRASGDAIAYGKLIWAAGGIPRRLSCEGAHLGGVHTLRTRTDADSIRGDLLVSERIVIIGGGYIGLEAAAALSRLGKQISVLESLDRVLARVAGAPLSRFFEEEHRSHGVHIHLRATVTSIEGRHDRVAGVRLADGRLLPADLVIVGVGVNPTVEPLLTAGADGASGVDVDPYCLTSLPDVYAIGDCAAHVSAYAAGRRVRIESVQNAKEMANAVARTICGHPSPYRAVPWFWSNQYDLRLQTVGLAIDHDDIVVRGQPAAGSFAVIYLRQGRVICLDCVNAAHEYAQGRALVASGARIETSALQDPNIPLQTRTAAN